MRERAMTFADKSRDRLVECLPVLSHLGKTIAKPDVGRPFQLLVVRSRSMMYYSSLADPRPGWLSACRRPSRCQYNYCALLTKSLCRGCRPRLSCCILDDFLHHLIDNPERCLMVPSPLAPLSFLFGAIQESAEAIDRL